MKVIVAEKQQPYVMEDGWYRLKFMGTKEVDGQFSPGVKFEFQVLDDRDLLEGEGSTRGKNVNGIQWSGGTDSSGGLLMRKGSGLVAWIQILTESFGDNPPEEIGESIDLKQLTGAVVEGFLEAGEPVVRKSGPGKGQESIFMNVTKIRLLRDKGSKQSAQRLSKKEDDDDEAPVRKKRRDDDDDDLGVFEPERRRRRDDDDDDPPVRKKKGATDDYLGDEFEEEAPPRKKKRDIEDLDELDEVPKSKKNKR